MTRVAVVTNVIALYRLDYYRRLIDALGDRLTIYCQDRIPGMNLQVAHESLGNRVRLVTVWSAKREKIAWQWLPYCELFRRYDLYFLEGNPRVLSTVIFATALRLLGKRVVICGQKHTAGANLISAAIRLLWWKTFRYIYLYSEPEAEQLRMEVSADKVVISMNNGLDQDAIEHEVDQWNQSSLENWKRQRNLQGRSILLSCARLEPKNRFSQAVLAVKQLVQIDSSILWCVIGDGVERDSLRQQVQELGLDKNVLWLGAIYHEGALAPWFLSATFLLHPAAIGLTLLHAYGYGLPVVTHNNSVAQMPEFAALTQSNRALCFKENDIKDMTAKCAWALNNAERLGLIAADARQVARTQYNTAIMAERFCAMIKSTGLPNNDRSACLKSP
jgi:glycosyltransferase involved in cell wall biosynthesis